MTNYSDNPSHVRIDAFRGSGKWYLSEMVDMTGFYELPPMEAVKRAVTLKLKGRLIGMWIVCLDPYCESPYPVMFKYEG